MSIRRWVGGILCLGVKIFLLISLSHFPHLYSDFRLYFSSDPSRFFSALAFAPPPSVPMPSAPLPGPHCSLLPRSSASSSAAFSHALSFPSSALPFSAHPVSSAPSFAPPAPLAPPLSQPPGFQPSLSSSPYPLRPSAALPASASPGVPVSAGVEVAACLDSHGAPSVSAPSLFRPFGSGPSAFSVPSAPSAPLISASAGVPLSASFFHPSAPSFDPAASFGFGASEGFSS